MCLSNYSSMIDSKWAKEAAEFFKNCDAETIARRHLAEAKLFVAAVDVSDDGGHDVPQGLLPGRIQPSLLLHHLPDDFCNQLARKATFRQVFLESGKKSQHRSQNTSLTLKFTMGILCLVAWLLARGLRISAWLPLAFRSSPSFFSTVAPWAETAALPASSLWAMPANLGKSCWVWGFSVNKLKWGHEMMQLMTCSLLSSNDRERERKISNCKYKNNILVYGRKSCP